MNLNKLTETFKLGDLNTKKKIFNTLVHNLQAQRYNFNNVTFEKSKIENCNLSESIFIEAKFEDAAINKLTVLHGDLSSVIFNNSIFEIYDCRDSNYKNCSLDSNTFKNCNFRGCDFSEGNLNENNFNNSDLKSSEFHNSIIKNTIFNNCDLYMAKFIGAYLSNVKFNNCNLFFTDFSDFKFDKLYVNDREILNINEINK